MVKKTHNREQRHSVENVPPHQEKYARGDDGWDIMTTACPIDTPKVNSNRGDANRAASLDDAEFMRPVYGEGQSYAFHSPRVKPGRAGE